MPKKTKQYTGCIGSIEKARRFARESFVYGMKDKSDFDEISPRAYDEVTRQMGDWFQDCMQTRTVKVRSKVKYLSLDCRAYSTNPLYKMWKAHSFTTNEIVFFFSLLEVLSDAEPVSIGELYAKYDLIHRTGGFTQSMAQNWLHNRGCPSEIVVKKGRGKYCLATAPDLSPIVDLLLYYSEIAPGGVIGSFILDKQEGAGSPFRFKQHYIGQAFDCEVLCNALFAIKNGRELELIYHPRGGEEEHTSVFPLKVYSSTRSGRQYLIAWEEEKQRFSSYRLDRIQAIRIAGSALPRVSGLRAQFAQLQKYVWGVSFGGGSLTHVEMLIKVEADEAFILNRLEREKRCGRVSLADAQTGIFKFEADVYDAREMFPWLRTFIGRITALYISDEELEKQFWASIQEMYKLYAAEGN